jgi:translocator protein
VIATRDVIGLIAWLLLCFAAAALGAMAAVDARDFYAQLILPSWAPPGSLFGPVWTTLYSLMSIAAWLVWRRHGFAGARAALVLFVVQLAVNALWSWLYFKWRLGLGSLIEVVILWALILATILQFWRFSRLAAWLLFPYLAWVTFATVLTYATWQLNKTIL